MNGNENLGVAFALVLGAGASTSIGAAVVFFPSLVKYASKKTLAAGLGLSSGVMIYVSFVEIFQKSVTGFKDAGIEDNLAHIYSTLCFFAGILFMMVLNFIVHSLLLGSHDHHHHHDHPEDAASSSEEEEKEEDSESDVGLPPCCSTDPAGNLEKVQQMGHELEEHDNQFPPDTKAKRSTEETDGVEEDGGGEVSKEETRKLNKMSINTALAIGLHNFPEGLATFVAALANPAVGAVLAIAIAIHNIPEGLCVSLPVYYATGNRWRAFMWGCLSGVSEPVAALFGWAILAHTSFDELFGVLFGMVAGMMVIISVRELLPTAHRYDPEDSVVTNSFIIGMCVIALSLVLFLL